MAFAQDNLSETKILNLLTYARRQASPALSYASPPLGVDQAEFNSSIVQNNKMNHSSRFHYILNSDDSYYKVRTLIHFK